MIPIDKQAGARIVVQARRSVRSQVKAFPHVLNGYAEVGHNVPVERSGTGL
jgi:hypothetical protein